MLYTHFGFHFSLFNYTVQYPKPLKGLDFLTY